MSDVISESSIPSPPESGTAEAERQFHHYTGNRIPWYVRLLWLGFWILAIAYVVQYLFPALQMELTSPP